MTPDDTRSQIAVTFMKLHKQIHCLRFQVETFDDQESLEILQTMEMGLLAPMGRLRKHLVIPDIYPDGLNDED